MQGFKRKVQTEFAQFLFCMGKYPQMSNLHRNRNLNKVNRGQIVTKSSLNINKQCARTVTDNIWNEDPKSGVQDALAHCHWGGGQVGGRGKPHFINLKSKTGFDNQRMSGPVQYAQSSCETRCKA